MKTDHSLAFYDIKILPPFFFLSVYAIFSYDFLIYDVVPLGL